MSKVTGVVDKILTFKGPKGAMYSIKLMDGELYGTSYNKPTVEAGDTIELEFKVNGQYKNADNKSIVVLSKGGSQSVASSGSVGTSAATSGYSGGSTWGKNTEQQIIISRQAARNTAIEWLNLLAGQEALPLPASAKTPKAKFQFLEVLLEQITGQFFDYSQGKEGTKSSSSGPSKSTEFSDLEDEAEWES